MYICRLRDMLCRLVCCIFNYANMSSLSPPPPPPPPHTHLVGSRLTHIHLLSGGILPLLSLLESTLTRHANTMALSKEARSLRVVRVRLDDGRRVIGVRYPLPLISEVASMLSMLSRSKQVICSKYYLVYYYLVTLMSQ